MSCGLAVQGYGAPFERAKISLLSLRCGRFVAALLDKCIARKSAAIRVTVHSALESDRYG